MKAAYQDTKLPVEQRVADLLGRMTLEEKAAQLLCVFDSPLMPGAAGLSDKGAFSPEKARATLKDGIGQIATFGSPLGARAAAEYRNSVQKWIAGNTRLGIPAVFHDEGLHGYVAAGGTSYPQAIGLASTWDPALLQQIFAEVAREARRRGAQQLLAPVLDLGRDPRYGRIEETYGEDPYLAARLGVAAVRGFQGNGPGFDRDHVVATAKHFLHGQPEGGTNVAPSNYSERILREQLLYPFEAAVKEAGIGSVMPSYNEIDGIPSHVNPWLLQQVLREEWGFRGVTVSDYFGVQQLVDLHHVAASAAQAGADALRAGVDVELPGPFGFSTLPESVRSGKVPQAALDAAVARVLTMKFELGLFENPYADPAAAEAAADTEQHRQLARVAAERAIILLKNDGNVLPLDRSRIVTLAVIGPNADRRRLGTYSGTPPYFVTVLEGVRAKAGPGITVVFAEGCRISEPDTDPLGNFLNFAVQTPDPAEDRQRIAEAVAAARGADAVLLVLGGNEAVSREAIGAGLFPAPHLGDVDTLELPGLQNELAKEILELGKPAAVLLLNGRPYSIGYLAGHAPAILEGWYLGQETGNAVANVLFGDVNPAGRLPVTIARNAGQLPVYYYQKPSAKRGYLWSSTEPLFPFGHGLSYTTFRYGDVKLEPASMGVSGTSTASVEVTNTGARAGDEVVQMYIHHETASVTQPVKQLRGFERIHLEPGETKTVRFAIGFDTLAFLNREMRRAVEPGAVEVMIGGSSARTVSARLEVTP
jgi:beta-glucosidase